MNNLTIAGNFSKYASSYDQNSDVQAEAAAMLARILPKEGIQKILEIGCGTGGYTTLLKNTFKDADIKAIDISGPMVKTAEQKFAGQKIRFEVGDIEKAELDGGYDLVTSNAVFHWLEGLGGVIKKAENSLEEDGALIFSAFGPKTFLELKAALHSAVGNAVAFTPDAFPGKSGIERTLLKYFKRVKVSERTIRESYPCLRDLLNKIKYSGTRGIGANIGKMWSPGLLKKIEADYRMRFGSIEATYQVFFCEARQ